MTGAVIVGVVVVAWLVRTYNRLVGLRNRREEAWAGIDVQLQRRADLVPSLVETVKGYAGHESAVLQEVTDARAGVVQASGPAASGAADERLTGALRSLFAVAEGYPELEASANFLSLQRQLAVVEEELAFARRYYNAVVEDLNTAVQRFPTLLVARPLGFSAGEYFRADSDARSVPDVDLDR
ncbi:MAG: LemA family protein [Actinobacteria bacterium]|nr:LemA family protein [Actinomycetota bacterium]